MGFSWVGYVWLVAGIGLLIAEILTSGFLLAAFGVAMIVTSVLAFLELGWKAQLIGFAASTVFVLVVIRPLFLRFFYQKSSSARTNTEALIGQVGIVRNTVGPLSGGRVQVGGEDWSAVSPGEISIEVGEKVQVVAVDGAKLVVRRMT